ncbi:MAG: hypothetical protein WDN28_02515 [Chthoniobacter sp.]
MRWKRWRNSLSVAQASGLSESCTLSALCIARRKVLTTVPGSGSSTSRYRSSRLAMLRRLVPALFSSGGSRRFHTGRYALALGAFSSSVSSVSTTWIK